jgi:hypothetical protein
LDLEPTLQGTVGVCFGSVVGYVRLGPRLLFGFELDG